ncbi:hypothetical protein AS593_06685 [Caulobacter vibrioides]|nr:hypothetical protein AS593_06685 [Caulobacter vibrioides]
MTGGGAADTAETKAVRGLFPLTVAVCTRPVETTETASPRGARRRHRQLGRLCASDALLQLGARTIALGEGSSPVWPEGLTGSISHCQTLCCAVAARAGDFVGLGVDVEMAAPLIEGVELVCSQAELAHFAAFPAPHAGNWPLLAFCAKEAAYKCQYALTGQLLDFRDFEITLSILARTSGRFTLRRTRPLPIPLALEQAIEGAWALDASHVYAGAWIEARVRTTT